MTINKARTPEPSADAPTPTTETPHAQENTETAASETSPTQDPQEPKPPPFPEHLRLEVEDFARKTDAFVKSLEPLLAPYRGLLEAMKQERKRYNAWLEAHPQRVVSYQDIGTYTDCQYMSNVEIRDTPEMGRGVFTTAPLKQGDLFLAEEAIVFAPQEDDPLIVSLLGMFANPWALTKELVQIDPERQALAAHLYNAHTDKSAHLLQQLAQIQAASPHTFPNAVPEALVRWIGTAQSNAFCFQVRQRKRVGVYILAAMLNHSCAPNASFSFEGTTIVMHAQKDVPAGEQLFSSYLGGRNLPVARRQQMLQERFHFTCRCPTCTTEAASTPTEDSPPTTP